MNQVLKVTINKDNFNYEYLQILNGIMNLTDSELEILSAIKDSYDEIKDWTIVSSSTNRKKIMERTKKSSASFNNILFSLRKKGCLKQYGNVFGLPPLLEMINPDIKKLELIIE